MAKQYYFQGSPAAIQAAAYTYGADADARARENAARNTAQGQVLSTLFQQPAQFANQFSNNYGTYANNLGGAFGAYAGGLGNMATAMANERSNLYGANAMAEAARMGALGNIGSAGLGAYGSASNASMDAWARNQEAYNQSLASMQMANQGAIGALGTSRNAALGNLGGAYGGAARAELAAGVLGGLGGTGGGGSFSASGIDGLLGRGAFSGAGGGASGGGGGAGDALAGLNGLQSNLMNNDMLTAAQQGNTDAMNRLDSQHMSSRGMPSQMLGQSLAGLMALMDRSTGGITSGMNQFYDNQQQSGRQFMDGMRGVRDSLSRTYGGLRGDLGKGFGTANTNIRDLWDTSLGRLPAFAPPYQMPTNAQRIAQLQGMIPGLSGSMRRRYEQELRERMAA